MKERLLALVVPYVINMVLEMVTPDKLRLWIDLGLRELIELAERTDNEVDDQLARAAAEVVRDVCNIE